MNLRSLVIASAFALGLPAAAEAQPAPGPQPASSEPLRTVGMDGSTVWLLSEREAVKAGDVAVLWEFQAWGSPRKVADQTAVGAWIELRFDCRRRTVTFGMVVPMTAGLAAMPADVNARPATPVDNGLSGSLFRQACERQRTPGFQSVANLAAGVALAQAPPPQPPNTTALRLLTNVPEQASFIPDQVPARQGDTVEVWTLVVYRQANGVGGGAAVEGGWFSLRIDCRANTMLRAQAIVFDQRLAVIGQMPLPDERPELIAPDTAVQGLRSRYCEGVTPAGLVTIPVAGVAEAIRLTREPGALPAKE